MKEYQRVTSELIIDRDGRSYFEEMILREWKREYDNDEDQLENRMWILDLLGEENIRMVLDKHGIELPQYIITAIKLTD